MAIRAKMDRETRAKQFMPFDALKGFREALHEREKVIVSRIELTEEAKEELDRTMQQIHKNDMVKVVYFKEGEYLQVTGMVSRFDPTASVLKVVNTKIFFKDIIKITKVKNSTSF